MIRLDLIIPKDYDPKLSIRETQEAIRYIRETFQDEFAQEMLDNQEEKETIVEEKENIENEVEEVTSESDVEDYEDFDPFLYSKLLDARDVMIEILQDREKKLNLRAALILEIARDVQECIDEEDIFSMDDVFDYYRTEEGIHEVETDFAEADHLTYIRKMFQNQYQMEHLRGDWESYLKKAAKLLKKVE